MDSDKWTIAAYIVMIITLIVVLIHFIFSIGISMYITLPLFILFEISAIILANKAFYWAKLQKVKYEALKKQQGGKK